MRDEPTLYAVLRDRRTWPDCTLGGLEMDASGHLSLMRIPGPADGVAIDLPPPYDGDASGVVTASCGVLALSDTANDRVEVHDGVCQAVFLLPPEPATGQALGVFEAPRGLWTDGGTLWVADSGNGRLQGFLLPSLELFAVIENGLVQPVAVARDGSRRFYVLDKGLPAVRRFDERGHPDTDFDLTLAAAVSVPGHLQTPFDPRFMALADDGTLFVSDAGSDLVLRFDESGAWREPLPAPASGARPRALAIGARQLYVADAATGMVAIQDVDDGQIVCWVSGYRGPVAGLAIDENGDLLLKPDSTPVIHRFAKGRSRLTEGVLVAGPLDAGAKQAWFRAFVEGDIPAGTAIDFDVFQSDDATLPPAAGEYLRAASSDTLLQNLVDPAVADVLRRYLWIRVTLHGAAGLTPTLRQVQAETPGEDYLDYLPATYGKADAPTGFLSRLLSLTRTELGATERRIDDVARLFSGDFAPPEALDWLAGWMAFEFPARIADDDKRKLIARIIDLQERRGTRASLREFIRLNTGVEVEIREAFQDRRIWILDAECGSRLGFDTGLPAVEPPGLVLPDPPPAPDSDYAECAPTIGSATVGEIAPLSSAEWASMLYSDTSYLFTVHIPADQAPQSGLVAAIADVLDREKPAHTEYRICSTGVGMRVGFQATVGVDAIVAGPAPSADLSGTVLDASFILGAPDSRGGRVGSQSRVGQTSVLGQETSP